MNVYDDSIKRAEGIPQYSDILIRKLDELTEAYQIFYETKAKLQYDSHLLSELISLELVILSHLLPKLEGSGEKAKSLLKKLDAYRPWLEDVMIPQIIESEKVQDLYLLILKSYDLLGLSTL
jgi:hypothetical protein